MDWNSVNYIRNQELWELVVYKFYSVTVQDFQL